MAAVRALNDHETALRLFEENLGLAHWAARKKLRRDPRLVDVPFEDILQESLCGLWEAALRFDATRGVRFSTFSAFLTVRKARQRLVRYVLGRHNGAIALDWRNRRAIKPGSPTRNVEIDWMAQFPDLSYDPDEIDRLIDRPAVIDAIYDALAEAEASPHCGKRLADLSLARFGEERTLESIGQQLGLTRERVRQLSERADRAMRRHLADLQDHVFRRRLIPGT